MLISDENKESIWYNSVKKSAYIERMVNENGIQINEQGYRVLDFLYDEETHNIDKITSLIHPEDAPLGIVEYKTGISRKAFNNWWRDRAIPASRSKFKEVLEELDITSSIELLEKCFGLSLSWIKEKESPVYGKKSISLPMILVRTWENFEWVKLNIQIDLICSAQIIRVMEISEKNGE